MEFKATGKLMFDPVLGKKPILSLWWMIVKTPQDIVDYYHYWFQKKADINLIKPKWGSHISVIRGEIPKENVNCWKNNEGKIVNFNYSYKLKWNDDYVWIDVVSSELLDIREYFGLKRKPQWNLHITIGKFQKEIYPSFKNLYEVLNLVS